MTRKVLVKRLNRFRAFSVVQQIGTKSRAIRYLRPCSNETEIRSIAFQRTSRMPSSIIYLTTCENLLIRQTNITVHRVTRLPFQAARQQFAESELTVTHAFFRETQMYSQPGAKGAINKIVPLSSFTLSPKPRINGEERRGFEGAGFRGNIAKIGRETFRSWR